MRTDEQTGGLWITLEEPPRNVLDVATIRALDGIVGPLPERRDLRAVVFRSGLPGTFSAGADVKDHSRERAPVMLEAFHGLLRRLDALPQITVAAVDGICLGGGCELALSCDVVLATPRATFGQPEIDLGCFPPAAAVLLPRLCGTAAAELILTGAPISAEEAYRIGLVTRVVLDLESETVALLQKLSTKSAIALAAARRALRQGGRARSPKPSRARKPSTARRSSLRQTPKRVSAPSSRNARPAGRTAEHAHARARRAARGPDGRRAHPPARGVGVDRGRPHRRRRSRPGAAGRRGRSEARRSGQGRAPRPREHTPSPAPGPHPQRSPRPGSAPLPVARRALRGLEGVRRRIPSTPRPASGSASCSSRAAPPPPIIFIYSPAARSASSTWRSRPRATWASASTPRAGR